MLTIKNCVLTSSGVEICIPSGPCLGSDDESLVYNGITVYSKDETYRMVWQVNEDEELSTEEGLNYLLEEMCESDIIQPVTPIAVNGLSGHCVAYTDGRNGNYEARFSLPNNQQVYFYIITEQGIEIEEVMRTQEFQAALSAVRRAD